MGKPEKAAQIDFGFFTAHGPQVVNVLQNHRWNVEHTINIFSESGKPAKPDNSYFRQLITQSCESLREGLDCYVFTIEQIKTIQLRMKGFILTVVNLDGIYQLTAERSANNERP